jgi:TonB family protein
VRTLAALVGPLLEVSVSPKRCVWPTVAPKRVGLVAQAIVLPLGLCMIAAALEQNKAPVHVSSEDAEAHILHRSYPSAPPEAQAARINGTVILEATISSSGDVESVRVVSGHPLLAQSAVEAVRGWKYKPFLENGMPVEAISILTVEFRPSTAAQHRWLGNLLFFVGLYALLATAWVRRSRDRNRQPRWRNRLLFSGLLILSVSLAELSIEAIYRYGLGRRFWDTPATEMYVTVNFLLCLVAGVFCLVGKGPGRWASFLAAPLLLFTWAIHVAF